MVEPGCRETTRLLGIEWMRAREEGGCRVGPADCPPVSLQSGSQGNTVEYVLIILKRKSSGR